MLTIMRFTFREAFNRKILLVSVIVALVFLALYWTGIFYAVRDIERSQNSILASVIYSQFLLLGLYFGGFIVSFLAILSSAGLISGEVESGAIQAVATKPVSRTGIVLGRFFGQGLFLAFYAAVFFAAIYAVVRTLTGMDLAGSWRAMAVFSLQPVVLLSASLLSSTLTTTIAGGSVVFMLYTLSVIGGFIEQIGWMINNLPLKNAGIISSLIMPVDSLYRKNVHILLKPQADDPLASFQQMGPFGSFAEPSMWMMVYTLAYVAALLMLAVYAFNKKDLG
ncbi:MAG: ABC transporter permease [Peptococcaceae bacterium]|nr:ABC transporter permease [Peptococcaceae bacterium]